MFLCQRRSCNQRSPHVTSCMVCQECADSLVVGRSVPGTQIMFQDGKVKEIRWRPPVAGRQHHISELQDHLRSARFGEEERRGCRSRLCRVFVRAVMTVGMLGRRVRRALMPPALRDTATQTDLPEHYARGMRGREVWLSPPSQMVHFHPTCWALDITPQGGDIRPTCGLCTLGSPAVLIPET